MRFRNSKFDITEGQPFTLEYDGCTQDPCAIYLERMVSTTGHEIVQTITGNKENSKITFILQGVPTAYYYFSMGKVDGAQEYSTGFYYKSSADPDRTIPESASIYTGRITSSKPLSVLTLAVLSLRDSVAPAIAVSINDSHRFPGHFWDSRRDVHDDGYPGTRTFT
ncbi:hypothetical protein O9K51_05129 [Purpureocillium lavendulum]|uniref:Uncharacterized protein n=1 Tax=Purpureocillium lavendulum TaxID=1247861 RepID=A0AB34FR42_9HYPO|nr:hypothetical protein O9K51_05129 [Purpureocillium lavendulum]